MLVQLAVPSPTVSGGAGGRLRCFAAALPSKQHPGAALPLWLTDLYSGASLHTQASLLEGLLSFPQTSVLQTDRVAVLPLVIPGR